MNLTKDSYFLFSGGEVHCKLSPEIVDTSVKSVEIICKDYSMNGFMALCQQKQILDNEGVEVHLTYPYFPYARQDRIVVNDEPFSLKIFCNLLNTQKFASVTVYDPHSDVVGALVENIRIIPQWESAKMVIPQSYLDGNNVIFVSPDAGAYKKLSKLITDDRRIAIGVKNRNHRGEITHTRVYSPTNLEDKECFIVDDICDGGKTFIELAKALKAQGVKRVVLYVTHGIFSKGLEPLIKDIDHIYTTNSFTHNQTSSCLTVVEVAC